MHTSRMARALLPQLAGEGGPEGRMGYGPPLRRRQDCTNVTANGSSPRPCFPYPIRRLRRHLPRFAEKGADNRQIFEEKSTSVHPVALVGEGEGGGHSFPAVRRGAPNRKIQRDPRPAPTVGVRKDARLTTGYRGRENAAAAHRTANTPKARSNERAPHPGPRSRGREGRRASRQLPAAAGHPLPSRPV